jgi:hypothetical protein
MKKASMILSHLSNKPQFRFLKQQVCYKKYISLLTPKYQKAIAFIYIKDDTLFIAVTHPGFKMELNYNKDLLKSILTQLGKHDTECEMMQASKVAVFHSKYHPIKKEVENISTVPYYNELASTDFEIVSDDEDIIAKFKQIKEQIKEQTQCNK